jgi:drug/metabolite transporter (DMT)-like permease
VKKWNPNHLNLIIYGFCSLAFLPFVEFSKFSFLNINDWLLLIFLGLNTLLAYGSLALAFKYTEANKVSVIITLNPIITFVVMMILGAYEVSWIDAENFSFLSLFGAGIVFTGASLVIIRKRK